MSVARHKVEHEVTRWTGYWGYASFPEGRYSLRCGGYNCSDPQGDYKSWNLTLHDTREGMPARPIYRTEMRKQGIGYVVSSYLGDSKVHCETFFRRSKAQRRAAGDIVQAAVHVSNVSPLPLSLSSASIDAIVGACR